MAVPEVRYARSGEVNIAYTRWGEGEQTVVFTPPTLSNVELAWELLEWERLLTWAGRHHQIVMIDKQGVGPSDRTLEAVSFRQRMDDTLAVMDQEDIDAAHLVGFSEGGVIGTVLAAEHPERVRGLLLVGAPAVGVPHEELAAFTRPDDPVPLRNPQQDAEFFRDLVRTYGTSESTWLDSFGPSSATDPRVAQWWQRFERQSANRRTILDYFRGFDTSDLRPYLEQVQAPLFIGHCAGDRVCHVAGSRMMAGLRPDATFVEWDSDDHCWWFSPNWRDLQNDLIEFITGQRPGSGSTQAFASVLFTDIVDSTRRASELGDNAWQQLLELHDTMATNTVHSHQGRPVKTTGDGILATFPDPAAAVTAALQLRDQLRAVGIETRAGIHVGQIEIRDDGDIAGIAVNIAARVESHAAPGEVLVSQTTRDMLLGTDTEFTDLGEHELKGIEGTWRLHRTEPAT